MLIVVNDQFLKMFQYLVTLTPTSTFNMFGQLQTDTSLLIM